ncbi:MAG: hypothetical protein JRJ56_05695 [Deltaproteobacteria bacterium]|nr:hypothetical protein [Deltaproteobacteria bacterium]
MVDTLLNSGYFQVAPGSGAPAPTMAEQGRTKIVSRRLRGRRPGEERPGGQRQPGKRQLHQEILKLLEYLHERLRQQGREIRFTFLEVPGGFLLRAYDCESNQQVCQLIRERFFHSPQRLEKLITEAISGMGLLYDAEV